jgi:hypothetical protein
VTLFALICCRPGAAALLQASCQTISLHHLLLLHQLLRQRQQQQGSCGLAKSLAVPALRYLTQPA